MELHYILHPNAVNPGEPVDWIVPPNGPKFACPSTGYVTLGKNAGAIRTVNLSSDLDASRVFRTSHP
jgi:hypothetical protein